MGTVQPRPTALDEAPVSRWEAVAIKALSVVSRACWIGAVILVLEQRAHAGFSGQALFLAICWDLSIASLGTGLAPHTRGADGRTALMWRAVRKLPEADRRELAAYSRSLPLAARPWMWRARSYFGVACWVLAAAFTIQVETGVVHVPLVRLAVTMLLLLAGGVQHTIAALVGMDRARHERACDIALYGPAAAEPVATFEIGDIASAALDERRDGTGEIPRYNALTLLHGNGERSDSRATGA